SNLVVTTNGDSGDDANPAPGSLREAILKANATGDHDTITFNLPGNGPFTFDSRSAIPAITSPVTIDGYSQSGASPNTLAGGVNAQLKIFLRSSGLIRLQNARGAVVRGLANSDTGPSLTINGGDSNVVEGNFLGFEPDGQHSENGGILVTNSTGNRIGTN